MFRAPEDANLSSQLLGKKGYGYTPLNRPTSAGVSAESGRFSSAPSASSTSLLDASARQFPGLRSRMVPSSHSHRRNEASAGASADVGHRLSAASSTFSTSCSCCGRGSLGLFAGQVLYGGFAVLGGTIVGPPLIYGNPTIWGSILGVNYLRSMRKASVLRASDGANLSTSSAQEMELQQCNLPVNCPASGGDSANGRKFSGAPSASSTSLLAASARWMLAVCRLEVQLWWSPLLPLPFSNAVRPALEHLQWQRRGTLRCPRPCQSCVVVEVL